MAPNTPVGAGPPSVGFMADDAEGKVSKRAASGLVDARGQSGRSLAAAEMMERPQFQRLKCAPSFLIEVPRSPFLRPAASFHAPPLAKLAVC